MARGRPPSLSLADKHEIRRYREAGVSIARLAEMYGRGTTTINQALREMSKRLGPEKLPKARRHLARTHLRTCGKDQTNNTNSQE